MVHRVCSPPPLNTPRVGRVAHRSACCSVFECQHFFALACRPIKGAHVATRIYVGNLPYTTDRQQLTQVFSAFGEVVEVTIVTDRDSGQSKGFGFVQMASEEGARGAIAGLNGSTLGDRAITVNEARPRPDRSNSRERRW